MFLWEAIHDWLVMGTPEATPVIKMHQDGRLPDRTFVVAKVIAERREGMASTSELQDDGTILIQQGALMTVSVNVFGPEAYDMAHGIHNSLEKVTVQDFLRSRGMAYVQVLRGPEDMSAIAGTGWEERAGLDVQMRAAITIIDDVGIIERVELTGDLGPVTYEQTIGV